MQVRFPIRSNVAKLKEFLRTLSYGATKAGLKGFVEYIVGNQQHGLKHYPGYKHVTRKSAYGKTFVSDAQRGYVMARIRDGTIDPGVPHRTGRVQRGWMMKETRGGYGYTIVNEEPGAYFTMDDKGQANQPALVGWRKVSKVISDNFAGAVRHAKAMADRYLKTGK